ncbi:MAG: hypothetical protein M3N19_04970 [Candidatus Eremiobacteraeota bacterium]|nr:hypothetical protein [Candidatus Eremiobacteraeota bacterium]
MGASFAATAQRPAGFFGAVGKGNGMNVMSLLLAAYTLASPVPLKHATHVTVPLPAGATAKISEQGNNVPCWDSPAALSAFLLAYKTGDQSAVAMHVANDSVMLEEGVKVKSLGTQGLLGQIVRLKLLDGENAGIVCYEPSSLQIYTGIKKRR